MLLAGLAMLVLPGPGLLVLALGFAVLGTEYAWALSALEHTKKAAGRGGEFARSTFASARGRLRRRPPRDDEP